RARSGRSPARRRPGPVAAREIGRIAPVSRPPRRLFSVLPPAAALAAVLGAAGAQASPWTVTNLNLGENETVFGLSCEASGFCVGVGQEAVVIQSSSPTGGVAAWSVGPLSLAEGLQGNLRAISCPSASLCV